MYWNIHSKEVDTLIIDKIKTRISNRTTKYENSRLSTDNKMSASPHNIEKGKLLENLRKVRYFSEQCDKIINHFQHFFVSDRLRKNCRSSTR